MVIKNLQLNMANNPLTLGIYELSHDCKAFVREGKVFVSKKQTSSPKCDRCADCAYFGKGRVTYYDHPNRDVCLAREKVNGRHNGYPKEYSSRKRYFAAWSRDKACDLFKPK